VHCADAERPLCVPGLPVMSCSALVSGQAAARASTSLSQLCLYNFLDIAAALGLALVVNVAVLLVAAATFHQAGEDSPPQPPPLLQQMQPCHT
jgi:Mn2+/Fe2+ NRAMP family transporter